MTLVKLTRAELRRLDIQKAQGLPFPDDIFAWREANAAAIAALEPLQPRPSYEGHAPGPRPGRRRLVAAHAEDQRPRAASSRSQPR